MTTTAGVEMFPGARRLCVRLGPLCCLQRPPLVKDRRLGHRTYGTINRLTTGLVLAIWEPT